MTVKGDLQACEAAFWVDFVKIFQRKRDGEALSVLGSVYIYIYIERERERRRKRIKLFVNVSKKSITFVKSMDYTFGLLAKALLLSKNYEF